MESKVCSICGIEKPLSEFALNKTRKDGHASDCKSCRKKYRDEHYRLHKEYYKEKAAAYKRKKTKELEEFKSTLKCEICGENRPWCLDFHHVNPEEKEGEIAKLIESQEDCKKN